MFRLDVAKAGVAYVAIAIHICCKCKFQMFQLFQTYVASVLFIWILHMLQWLSMYIASLCSKCFAYLRPMLQVFHLDVACVSDICCKRLFKIFHLFQMYVASVFHLDVVVEMHICCKHMYVNVSPISDLCCRSAIMLQH
jgi:hypothetical protein